MKNVRYLVIDKKDDVYLKIEAEDSIIEVEKFYGDGNASEKIIYDLLALKNE